MEAAVIRVESPKLTWYDLSSLVESVTSKMRVMFEGLLVRVSIEKDIFVDGDSHYLEQAIKNYVMNAVSHTPTGGHISISLYRQGDKALFSVFNEGDHISQDDMVHIWESFYKTDKSRVRMEESHYGLGLYIVKTIISAHGGEYGMRNTEKGVEFWFSLAGI